MEALVLAGGEASADLQARGVQRVPLLRVGGETILARTCRALIDGGGAELVLVLAPEEVELPALPQVRRGNYSGDLMADITAAVHGFSSDGLLVSTGDMPLLSAAAARAVVELARKSGADVVYPVVEKNVMESRFPGGERTYKKLADGTYTAGNLFFVNRQWLLRSEPLIRKLFAMRKDPMALARFFGLGFAMKVMSGSASLGDVEQFLGRKVGVRLVAPAVQYAELAADIDKAADLHAFATELDDDHLHS